MSSNSSGISFPFLGKMLKKTIIQNNNITVNRLTKTTTSKLFLEQEQKKCQCECDRRRRRGRKSASSSSFGFKNSTSSGSIILHKNNHSKLIGIPKKAAILVLALVYYYLCILNHALVVGTTSDQQPQRETINTTTIENNDQLFKFQQKANSVKDFRWPNRQLNVLIDTKSINETEQQILLALFDQIEHRTCVKINQLSLELVNPYDTRALSDLEKNFVYIFKTQFGQNFYHAQPTIGLSSFGCVKQGRQSMILNDLSFKWPELILRYHVLRTLGVESIERPDGELKRLLNMLPLSQKINNDEHHEYVNQLSGSGSAFDPKPAYFAYATQFDNNQQLSARAENSNDIGNKVIIKLIEYLHDDDIVKIKQLYNCTDYQNKLSLKPLNEIPENLAENLKHHQQHQSLEKTNAQQEKDKGKISTYYGSSTLNDNDNNNSNKQTTEASTSISENNQWNGSSSTTITPTPSSLFKSARTEQAEKKAEESLKEILNYATLDSRDVLDKKGNDSLIEEAAKSIVNYLLSESEDEANAIKENSQMATTPSIGNQELIDSFFDRNGDQKPSTNGANSNKEGNDKNKQQTNGQCKPMESCPLLVSFDNTTQQNNDDHQERSSSSSSFAVNSNSTFDLSNTNGKQDIKPMMLKLDPFHAQDPQLQLADQMKLSQLNDNNLQTYRLLNMPSDTSSFGNLNPQEPFFQNNNNQQNQMNMQHQQQQQHNNNQKSEMLISFEQSNLGNSNGNPIAALASSQVLKLCSCTCQTMVPTAVTPFPPSPRPTTFSTEQPPSPTSQTPHLPTFSLDPIPTTQPTTTTITELPPTPTPSPSTTITEATEIPVPPTTTTEISTPPSEPPFTTPPPQQTTTEAEPPTPTQPDEEESSTPTTDEEPATPTPPPSSTSTTTTTQQPPQQASSCNLVEWVKPKKTVYSSAKIVWDVDRANQNYFLCNSLVNGELIPGKTHGFSCKLSSEGKALELHNFSVLTKPESVNLAWVQKDSDSLGKTNLPVIGGYSKSQDPYIVSRCLVRDENNDVITLIGYVNNQNVGWFPFDDIQIECGQYDVLACVN